MKLTVSTSFPYPPRYAEELREADRRAKIPDEFYTITDKGRKFLDDYRRNQTAFGAHLR
nr:MAG TPA: Mrr N-terminal domain [Caudoviricetes sp.]